MAEDPYTKRVGLLMAQARGDPKRNYSEYLFSLLEIWAKFHKEHVLAGALGELRSMMEADYKLASMNGIVHGMPSSVDQETA